MRNQPLVKSHEPKTINELTIHDKKLTKTRDTIHSTRANSLNFITEEIQIEQERLSENRAVMLNKIVNQAYF